LGLAAFRRFNGLPIGMQHILSPQFAQTRGFGSDFWFGVAYQRQGFCTELGRIALKLGFEGLDAEEASISAWSDNHRSTRMMEKIKHRPSEGYRQIRGEEFLRDQRIVFSRNQRQSLPTAQFAIIAISGMAARRELFGLS
jgi:RimJ/RimL family protein N-acetyltransferase